MSLFMSVGGTTKPQLASKPFTGTILQWFNVLLFQRFELCGTAMLLVVNYILPNWPWLGIIPTGSYDAAWADDGKENFLSDSDAGNIPRAVGKVCVARSAASRTATRTAPVEMMMVSRNIVSHYEAVSHGSKARSKAVGIVGDWFTVTRLIRRQPIAIRKWYR